MIPKSKKLLILMLPFLIGCGANEEALINKAKEKMANNSPKEAVSYISDAISKNNSNADSYNLRGVAYFLLKDYSNALEDFSNSIQLDSSNYKPYYNRGNVYLETKDYEKALFDYNRAINLLPNNADLYINRAIVLYELDQYEAALADNDFAIKLSPNNHLSYLNKGKTLVKLGNFQLANESLLQVTKINDQIGEAYYWLGFIEINTANNELGCDYLIKAKNRGFEMANEALEKYCKTGI